MKDAVTDLLGKVLTNSLQRAYRLHYEHHSLPHKRGEIAKCQQCKQERIEDTDADDWDPQS